MTAIDFDARSIQERHLALVDAANDAPTETHHRIAVAELRAWRQGLRDCGRRADLSEADWHTGARVGHPELDDDCPGICCGVILDWHPGIMAELAAAANPNPSPLVSA